LANPSDRTANANGKTDANGNVTLTLPCLFGNVSISTQHGFPGYYPNGLDYQFTNVVSGKWQPWNPIVDLIVKPILNPIPMYARNMGALGANLTLPAKNIPIGFDLEAADFVAPYGKGTVSDLIFTLTEKVPFVNYSQPFDISLNLSFSNKGDGIQSVIVPPNQGKVMPRYAPDSGYKATLVQKMARYANGKGLNTQVNENQNYFFRVRSVLDEQGNVKSALYGKIYGEIGFWGNQHLRFTYYLNPNSNDRNLEFDPAKNLFQNLPMMQQVKAP